MSLDPLEQKFFNALSAIQYRNVIERLCPRGMPESELSSTIERIMVACARVGAADLRKRLPEHLRAAYADRRHWRGVLGPAPAQGAPTVDQLVRASYDACLARLTVDDIVDGWRDPN